MVNFSEVLRCLNPFVHFPTHSSGANCFRRRYANYLIDHSVRWSLRVFSASRRFVLGRCERQRALLASENVVGLRKIER